MEIKKTVTQEFQNKISLLRVRFLIATDEYRNQLKQQYLEGKKKTKNRQITKNLKDIYSQTFMLSAQVNSNIILSSQKIENLDTYLDNLKKTVEKENKLLGQVENSQMSAVPRKQNIREQMDENYITSSYFILAVIVASYSIYNHYK